MKNQYITEEITTTKPLNQNKMTSQVVERLENRKFRLPRKTKKKLKKRFYTYPKSERNTYLLAWPYRIEKDYVACKQGLLRVV